MTILIAVSLVLIAALILWGVGEMTRKEYHQSREHALHESMVILAAVVVFVVIVAGAVQLNNYWG